MSKSFIRAEGAICPAKKFVGMGPSTKVPGKMVAKFETLKDGSEWLELKKVKVDVDPNFSQEELLGFTVNCINAAVKLKLKLCPFSFYSPEFHSTNPGVAMEPQALMAFIDKAKPGFTLANGKFDKAKMIVSNVPYGKVKPELPKQEVRKLDLSL